MEVRALGAVALGALLMTACAGWPRPSPDAMQQLPVVQFGEVIPADSEYVLRFPAGKPLSTQLAVDGSLLKGPSKQIMNITLGQDLYVYKQWVSFDRLTWYDSSQAIGFDLDIRLPSYERPEPGSVHVRLDAKLQPEGAAAKPKPSNGGT